MTDTVTFKIKRQDSKVPVLTGKLSQFLMFPTQMSSPV